MKKSELLTQSTELLNRLHVQFMKKSPFRFRTAENAAYFEKLMRVQNRAFARDRRRFAAWHAEVNAFIESRPDLFPAVVDQPEASENLGSNDNGEVSEASINSGDTFAASLPLSPINCSSVPGEVRDDSMGAGQGGIQFNPPPACLAIEPRFAYSCDCPECTRFNALILSEVDFAL